MPSHWCSLVPSGFLNNTIYIFISTSDFSDIFYMPYPSHSSGFIHHNHTRWRIQLMETTAFWDVMPYSVVNKYWWFRNPLPTSSGCILHCIFCIGSSVIPRLNLDTMTKWNTLSDSHSACSQSPTDWLIWQVVVLVMVLGVKKID